MSSIYNFGETQQALLKALLNNRNGLSIEELSSHLSISRNAVVQHVNSLSAGNIIENFMTPSRGGRPSRAYRLTDVGFEIFPRHYALFSKLLLELVHNKFGEEALEGFMIQLGEIIGQQYSSRIDSSLPLEEKVQAVNTIMYELGYETRPTSADNNREIIADNCVFHQLAKDSEKVCELDITLIENLTHASVKHDECMVKGGDCCRFTLTAKK